MAGSLTHSAADVIAQLLVDLSLGTDPVAAGDWATYAGQEPDKPDKCITVFDTEPTSDGRVSIDGEVQEQKGYQIRLRSVDHPSGWLKADTIATELAKTSNVLRRNVTIDSSVYLVHSCNKKSGPFGLGEEEGTDRYIFTINFTSAIRQTS